MTEARLQALMSEVADLKSVRDGLGLQVRSAEGYAASFQTAAATSAAYAERLATELSSANEARRDGEFQAVRAVNAAQRTEQAATAALQAARATMSQEFALQMEAFKLDLERRHEAKIAEFRAEAEAYRAATHARHEQALAELSSSAEARHAEAMGLATAVFQTKEGQYVAAFTNMKEQCLMIQRSAQTQLETFELEKRLLQRQVVDLSAAATVASLGPLGGTPGVLPDVQFRLDSAIRCVESLKDEVRERDDALAKFQSVLRTERVAAKELEVRGLAFQAFVDKRESGLKFEILQLNEQVFMIQNGHGQEDPGSAALNAAHVQNKGLEGQVKVLRAQLYAATNVVNGLRASVNTGSAYPQVPDVVPEEQVSDIRHPTLHRQGGFLQAGAFLGKPADFQTLDDWYQRDSIGGQAAPPNLRSLNKSTTVHNMCGSGVPLTNANPQGGPLGHTPLVFNAFQTGSGGRAPLPSEDPSRLPRPGVPHPLLSGVPHPLSSGTLRAPGPSGPPEFRPQPQRETVQQQGFQQYQTPAGFKSFVSEIAYSEIPPGDGPTNPDGAAESSDYESEPDDDPNNPAGNVARRAKAVRQWRMYREFNSPLTIAPVPDHASKFRSWKDVVRADVATVSKAGQKAFNWICRAENNDIPDDALRVCKRKWEALDAKIRAALLKVATGEIQKTFELLSEEERVKNHRQISGAFMLRVIYRRFQTKNSLAQYYDFSDVQKVTFKNDNNLEGFLQEWRSKLNGLERPEFLHSGARLEMFVRQLKGSALMKYDMEVHKRSDDKDTDRSYALLVLAVEARIREQRNLKVEMQLGHGSASSPPALAAPPGTICRFFTQGTCRKAGECDMIHDKAAQKAFKAAVASGKSLVPDGGGSGGGRGGGRGGGGNPAAKGAGRGGGKGQAAPGGGGKIVGMKGGNPASKYPCYANYSGKCTDDQCKHAHRALTPAEIPTWESWKVKSAGRAASPGAPASGVCPDFLKGECVLGPSCAMEHPEELSKSAKKRAAAKAKAAGQ
jgi:hypothetical protein